MARRRGLRAWLGGLAVGAALIAGLADPAAAAALHILGWGDAIAPAVMADFERQTGIRVTFDPLDSPAAVEKTLLAGGSFDLAVVADASLPRLIAAHALTPLDMARLPHASAAAGILRQAMAMRDPGNRFAAPYMWGALGFGFDVKAVRQRLGEVRPDSWQWLLRADHAAKLRDCGIAVLDDADAVLPGVMRYLGLAAAAPPPEAWQRAADALARARGQIRRYQPETELADALAGGDVCVVLARSRTVQRAARRAALAGTGAEISFAPPREGAPIWFDALVVPRGGVNGEPALAFIDYLLRPEIAARNAAFLGEESPLTDASGGAAFATPLPGPRLEPQIVRLWQRVKAAR